MRVLYLMYNGLIRPSGEQSLNFHRLRALEWAGARTWVAAQEAPADLAPEVAGRARAHISDFAPSAELLFYRRKAAWPRRMMHDLARLCQDQAIDVLVFTQVQNLVAVRKIRAATSVPVLWDCRAGADARVMAGGGLVQRAKNAAFRAAYRPAARLCNHIVVVSEKHLDHMASRFSYPRHKMTVVPNCTDVSQFRPDPVVRRMTREMLGIDAGRLVVVFCGSMQPWQCFPEGIALFAEMRSLRKDAHLLVVTPDVERAKSLTHHLASEGAVTVSSAPHAEVPRYLAAADIGLLLRRPTPRNAVASPTKFAEYMACGLPTAIGPEVGDYTQLVKEHELGVVVNPDAPDAWPEVAKKLVSLAGEEKPGARERCRDIALRLLSTEVQKRGFISALSQVALREATSRSGGHA